MQRKICFVITSFVHYSRNFLILEALQGRLDVELHVILGGAALLPKYISRRADIKADLLKKGVQNIHEMYFNLEGTLGITKAKTAGLGVIEFASMFEKIRPDLIVVRADRFEVLSAAIAAAYMNIPIAHIEGGDVSGTIDESVRHAITKFSHIHFVTNEDAEQRVLRMGEDPQFVFNFGSPDIEVAQHFMQRHTGIMHIGETGSGARLELDHNYIMVMYHPVTTEVGKLAENTKALLSVIHDLGMQTIWFWPNFDAGAEEIARELRTFNDTVKNHQIHFMRYLPPQEFFALLSRTKCLVGNSSSGLKECSYLGIPVVNVGSRQNNRLRAQNVIDAKHDAKAIRGAIIRQMQIGRYPPADVYRADHTSQRIAETLATVPLYTQKTFVGA